MADSKQAWDDVGERFGALARRFRERGEEAAGAGGAEPATEASEATEHERKRLQAAIDELGRAIDRVAGAVGPTVRDPGFRDDAKAAARSLGEALTATFADVGGTVRGALRRDKGGAPGAGGPEAGEPAQGTGAAAPTAPEAPPTVTGAPEPGEEEQAPGW